MPTDQEIFYSKMDALADSINAKAGLTGVKNLDELKTAVDNIVVVPDYPAEDGTYKLIGTVESGEGSMSWEADVPVPSQYYAVTFMNGDTVFEVQVVPSGGNATTPSGIPTKEGDASHTYVFIGWDGSMTNITAPTMIHAIFMDIGSYISISTPVAYCADGTGETPIMGSLSTTVRRLLSRNLGSNPYPTGDNLAWIASMVEIPDTDENLIGIALDAEFDLTLQNNRDAVTFSSDVLDKLRENIGGVWFRKNDVSTPNFATLATAFESHITHDQSNDKIFHCTAKFIFLFDEATPSDNITVGIYTGWSFGMAVSNNQYDRVVNIDTSIVSASYIPITQTP